MLLDPDSFNENGNEWLSYRVDAIANRWYRGVMKTKERSAPIMEVDVFSPFGNIKCVKFQADIELL